jgi:hypothetical protein
MDVYRAPESSVLPEGVKDPQEIVYNIDTIKSTRRWMVGLFVSGYVGSYMAKLIVQQPYSAIISGLAGLAMLMIVYFLPRMAWLVYRKWWVSLIFFVLALLPIVNLLSYVFLNIKAKDVILYSR